MPPKPVERNSASSPAAPVRLKASTNAAGRQSVHKNDKCRRPGGRWGTGRGVNNSQRAAVKPGAVRLTVESRRRLRPEMMAGCRRSTHMTFLARRPT